MFARRRPLLRAAAVGGGAYAMGKRRAERSAGQSEQGAAQGATVQEPAQPQGQAAEPSMSDQLRQLSELHESGALSDAEFASAKSKLLGT